MSGEYKIENLLGNIIYLRSTVIQLKTSDKMLENWYLENLVCPQDKTELRYSNNCLVSKSGHHYPIINGIPIMLLDNVKQTIELAHHSLKSFNNNEDEDPYFINTLGISDQEKERLRQHIGSKKELKDFVVDPIVQFLIAATNGILYKDSIGTLTHYPIPNLRLPKVDGEQKQLLDIGCSWGRWCISGSQKKYICIGIDPSLGAVLAGQRIAQKLGLNIKFVVGDARYLPFKESIFDQVFCYSVIQHFSKNDAKQTLTEINRVLKVNGQSLIQMPNRWGIRSLQHQIKRGFKEGESFDVRYWGIKELNDCFTKEIGESQIDIDGFFGLGIQKSDLNLLHQKYRIVVRISETLRSLSQVIPSLKYIADSVYIKSIKQS